MKNFIFALVIFAALVGLTCLSAYQVKDFAVQGEALLKQGDAKAAYILYMERKNLLSLTVNGNELRLLHEALCRSMEGDKAAMLQAQAICQDLMEKESLFR